MLLESWTRLTILPHVRYILVQPVCIELDHMWFSFEVMQAYMIRTSSRHTILPHVCGHPYPVCIKIKFFKIFSLIFPTFHSQGDDSGFSPLTFIGTGTSKYPIICTSDLAIFESHRDTTKATYHSESLQSASSQQHATTTTCHQNPFQQAHWVLRQETSSSHVTGYIPTERDRHGRYPNAGCVN